jgi:hypothetical protein
MADEQEAIAETTGLETATAPEAITEPTVTDEPERIPGPEEVAGELEGAEETVEEELEEFEWNGKKVQGPKGLKDGVLMQADYTKKTQTVAEKAKALESREAEINQRLEATEEELDARATLRNVDARLAEYGKLTQEDWDHHHSIDPMGTEKAWRDYQFLKEQRGEIAKTLETKQAERTGKAQQELAKRIQDTLEHAKKSIPGFKPETIPQLVEFAQEIGVPAGAIEQNWSPTFVDLLHLARIGKMTVEKQATAPKLPTTTVQPLTTVNGKTTPAARGDLSSMDMEAYVAARKKGIGGKPLR